MRRSNIENARTRSDGNFILFTEGNFHFVYLNRHATLLYMLSLLFRGVNCVKTLHPRRVILADLYSQVPVAILYRIETLAYT